MKNNLKLLAGTAAISFMLFTVPAMAATDAQMAQDQSGFYVGGYGGYGWTDGEVAGPDLDINGGDYGVFAGYEMTNILGSGNIAVNGALEFHYGWSSADDSAAGTSVDKDNEWGISFRPGMTFLDMNSLKPYGIVGYRRTEFDSNVGGDHFNGFELGLGTELIAMGDLGLRADYTHVWYGSEGGLDPDEDDLRVGVAYHF
jgi:outer membrane immunogenic protein